MSSTFPAKKAKLEENSWTTETFHADCDVADWKLVNLLLVRNSGGVLHSWMKVQSEVTHLVHDKACSVTFCCGGERHKRSQRRIA